MFALAMAAGAADEATRRAALDALPRVAAPARTCSSSRVREGFRGWGRALRRAVGALVRGQPADALAYQAVKYRQREGVIAPRPAAPRPPGGARDAGNPTLDVSAEHARLFEWIVRGGDADGLPRDRRGLRARAGGGDAGTRRRRSSASTGCRARRVRPEHLDARRRSGRRCSSDMPMTAMIRNLATMTRVGAARARARTATARVVGAARRRRAAPQRARAPDRGARGAAHLRGGPRRARPARRGSRSREIVDALDDAFYVAFGNVEPAGKRLLLALDVSGSMEPARSPACRASRRARRRPRWRWSPPRPSRRTRSSASTPAGAAGRPAPRRFGGGEDGLTPLAIGPRQRLDDAVRTVSGLPFGGTDCALPMLLRAGARAARSTRS